MRNLVNGVRWMLRGGSGTAATVQTFAFRLLTLATNLATGIITARTLAPVGRGEQAAMILWPQFLAYAMTLGLPSALLYNLKRHPDKKSELLSAALLLGSGLGIVATLIGVVFIPSWLSQYSKEVIQTAQWFMLIAPLNLVSVIINAAFEAQSDFTTANQMRYMFPLSTLVILVVLALAKVLTPFTAGLAYLLPNLPIFIWMLVRIGKHFQLRWRGLGASCKRLLTFGVRSYGIDLLGSLGGQIDQALVINLLAPASLGLYVVALSISRMLNVFQSSVVTVLYSKAAARPTEEVVALTGRAARVSTALSLVVAVIVIIFGPVLLHLLYGAKYMGAVPVFRILVIEVVVAGTDWVLSQAFMALGQPGIVTILQSIGLGLSVPLMLVLIPTYGLEGAGLALLASTTARLVSVLMSFPLVLKVRPPGLLITREDLCFLQEIFQSKKDS